MNPVKKGSTTAAAVAAAIEAAGEGAVEEECMEDTCHSYEEGEEARKAEEEKKTFDPYGFWDLDTMDEVSDYRHHSYK